MAAKTSVGLVVAALVSAAVGYFAYSRHDAGSFTVAANGAPIRTGRASTTEQTLCAEKGKTIFEGSGYSNPDPPDFTAVYTAYYNARLGHCYLAITSTHTANKSTLVELFDADDKKLYGQYSLAPADGAKPGEIVGCTMQTPAGAESTCTAPGEWTAFITGYMN